MANLKSDNLILNIEFNSFENEWINYDIRFYWNNEIIINDNILKRTPPGYWDRREIGTFIANDYEKDDLIDTIKKALNTNKAVCWEPMEPDAKIAIYPGRLFPFVETRYNLFEEMEKMRTEGNLYDTFTVITFIDEYNFKDSDAYSGEGISLHLIVERNDLEKFMEELEIEYKQFKSNNEEGDVLRIQAIE